MNRTRFTKSTCATGVARLFVFAAAMGGLSACSSSAADGTCEQDSDCGPGSRCNTAVNLCACVTSEACQAGEFCNALGLCQLGIGCSSNADCGAGTFCDLNSGSCLATSGSPAVGSVCSLASHCPFGTVCGGNGVCAEGCFADGDCPLGQICLDQGEEGIGRCFIGEPGTTICSNDDYCEYGDACGSDNFCADDLRGPYCRSCTPRTQANPNPCDDPRNFCLINNQEFGGFSNFCGVDCSQPGQSCPSGYQCSQVVVLTQAQCGRTPDCRCTESTVTRSVNGCSVNQVCDAAAGGFCAVEGVDTCAGATCFVPSGQTGGECACASDADCPSDGQCVGGWCCAGGQIRPEESLECVGGEGAIAGRCTCATDADCGQDSCDPTLGACTITGFPCVPGESVCPPIACINGGCLIGQNCAPEQGLTCSIVRD